jgi:hypothetical protein
MKLIWHFSAVSITSTQSCQKLLKRDDRTRLLDVLMYFRVRVFTIQQSKYSCKTRLFHKNDIWISQIFLYTCIRSHSFLLTRLEISNFKYFKTAYAAITQTQKNYDCNK